MVAAVCLIAGAVIFPLPIPLGLPLIFVGVCIILSINHVARDLLRTGRRRWPRLDNTVRHVQDRVPRQLRGLLVATDPLTGK